MLGIRNVMQPILLAQILCRLERRLHAGRVLFIIVLLSRLLSQAPNMDARPVPKASKRTRTATESCAPLAIVRFRRTRSTTGF